MRENKRITKAGPHPHKKLTARTVQSTTAPGRYADGDGLYLLVAPGGSRSWMLRTLVHGTRRDIGLGGLSLVTLAEAREQAIGLRKIARAGGDPLAQRRETRRVVPAFEAAAREVHREQAANFRNDKHRKQWLTSLDPMFAAFGSRRVDTVSSADIIKGLNPIWLTKAETATRILQRTKLIFDWAKAKGFCTASNPTEGIKKVLPKQKRTPKHHAALPYAQLPAFVRALKSGAAGDVVKLALELCILCALRTSEVLKAEWSEVDLPAKTWTIPGVRMKGGKDHRVPLSPRAVAIFRQAAMISAGAKYVFPGAKAGRPLSNMSLLMASRRLGYTITTHGFRSTFRDWSSERTNFPRAVCEAALAHALPDKTEAAYNRTDLFQRRRRLMNAWTKFATSAR